MKRWLFVLAPALCLFISANAFTQERTQERNRRAVHPTGHIMGMDIRNTKNESLGHVEDFVVNMKDGKCVYVAMARGQVLGFGGSMFAIAPDALTLSANGDYLVLNANAADFENAKGFDQNNWPNQPDRRWSRTAANNADTPNREQVAPNRDNRDAGRGNENLARISSLNGLYVYGRDDKQLGRVYDIALNCNKHQIAYVAVHHGGTLGIGGKLIPVAWDALTMKAPALDPQRRAFFIDASQQDFDNAQGFTTDNWPETANTRFGRTQPREN
jgi:sporulation protein YlmC with PRC-barrel domain